MCRLQSLSRIAPSAPREGNFSEAPDPRDTVFKAPLSPQVYPVSEDPRPQQIHTILHTLEPGRSQKSLRGTEKVPEAPLPTNGAGQEVSGGLSGLSPHPSLRLSLLPTLPLPRLPGLWVIGKINLSAQLAGSNQSLGLGCNLIPWGGGRRVELSWGLSGRGSPHPTPLPATVSGCKDGRSSGLLPTLSSQSPTSLLSGLLFVCDPQGEHPHSLLILLMWYWFPLPLSWVLAATSFPRGPSQSLC